MKVSIIGATGYTGAELLRILSNHSEVQIEVITSERQNTEDIRNIYPHLNALYKDIEPLKSIEDFREIAQRSDAVFIALPHGHSMKVVQKILAVNPKIKIIDLGADYRLKSKQTYKEWYKTDHLDPETDAAYGLTELNRKEVQSKNIIANPGCYTTASILALTPLVKNKFIDNKTIIVDAKSGATGAGRTLSLGNHFGEVFENFKAYGVASHRHTPEIEQEISKFADEEIIINFTPHLVPMNRGILSVCYANLAEGIDYKKVTEAFESEYGNEFFIRLLGEKAYPATKNVRGSNFCDIAWHIDSRTNRVIVLSAIDNLVKGASGQAVQNLNATFGLDERLGLTTAPLYP
ncbi:N-acetyl-gamma-glutamyl-phosphate reductase [Selenomonadales bacterium OttesenSCG-928-I06]|nr:N-acetyl-gamma-glutamyl-phosphate reductase [Selenomonadales bacterium OttesenSCG-928-I06]